MKEKVEGRTRKMSQKEKADDHKQKGKERLKKENEEKEHKRKKREKRLICHIHLNSKQVDLSYYDLSGSPKIVLVRSSKIACRREKLKHAVVETFHCMK
ncbi:hypothetical protein K1719_000514 [Acacia pycnantha]|nr:hypothetical protein K1719_000514 [Acacia pycnantha]